MGNASVDGEVEREPFDCCVCDLLGNEVLLAVSRESTKRTFVNPVKMEYGTETKDLLPSFPIGAVICERREIVDCTPELDVQIFTHLLVLDTVLVCRFGQTGEWSNDEVQNVEELSSISINRRRISGVSSVAVEVQSTDVLRSSEESGRIV
jgi:hypothetical protein